MSKISYVNRISTPVQNEETKVEESKEKWYTIRQASECVGLDYSTLNKACHQGKLRCSEVPRTSGKGYQFLISESSLTEWYVNRKERAPRNQKPTAPLPETLTVEDIANEILQRMRGAWEEGYKQGRKEQKAEMLNALRDVK